MLYVVGSPIGNLDDITLRALKILRECDIVVAEEPNITKKLLAKYDLHKPVWRYHEKSSDFELDKVLSILSKNNVVFLTSAGTPGISDPAGKLVQRARAQNIEIEAIPGPSALTTFVSISGRDFSHFHFVGFLPHKKGRQTIIANLFAQKDTWPIVFYERGTRIPKLIEELKHHFKDGEIIIAKELTKIHQELFYFNLTDVVKLNWKGEFVLAFIPERRKR